MSQGGLSATIVIPAHNEEAGLRRLLPALLRDSAPGELRVIVVCNGCSDDSAAEARRHGPDVEVTELPEPSKAQALKVGGSLVTDFPVAFIDADVELDTTSVRRLVAALRDPGTHAVAPARRLARAGVSRRARWYYDVWEELPAVRSGLFGRGVIALSDEGYNRVVRLPHYLSDDLAFSEAFDVSERAIVQDAVVTVWPARTWQALKQRRIRVVRGTAEMRDAGALSESATTHPSDLLRLMLRDVRLVPKMPFFLAMTIAARRKARGGGVTEWNRDESSRVL
ncbi:glycosyltransferase [Diaminobutyricimonas sp. LJ205]|uniref:glycosyltransferase n=1 Tax=Diaminobutyricimonas sp. LJ205 TaxID=2683590 RepID=UPI0012F486B4|nr:glycosyltransferase [Diaminobutyricimonas sp. LJ205]